LPGFDFIGIDFNGDPDGDLEALNILITFQLPRLDLKQPVIIFIHSLYAQVLDRFPRQGGLQLAAESFDHGGEAILQDPRRIRKCVPGRH
jgi:hypothetical protein